MSAADPRLDEVFRRDHPVVLAALIRSFGDRHLAEDALAEAWVLAADRWARHGWPDKPAAWLLTVARHRAIDRIRREEQRHDREAAAHRALRLRAEVDPARAHERYRSGVGDDVLRLIFTCCHPALAPEVRVPLTLRTLCGLTTAEIARAFMVSESTMAQRLVRAQRKIAQAGIAWRVPAAEELPERLDGVLRVVYLIFNEGYGSSSGDDLVREDLCAEAIRLGRMLAGQLPDHPEVAGLVALMLCHHARRATRTDAHGDIVLLEDQDRARWDRGLIAEAEVMLAAALRRGRVGPYQLQGAIAATHAVAPTWADTDWHEVLGLYDLLARMEPSPVVDLNRGVAVAMVHGPERGLAALDQVALPRSPYLPAARADLLRRLGRLGEAADAYRAALEITTGAPERRFLARRLNELGDPPQVR